MAKLENATVEELTRLLQLFPADILKDEFGRGDKEQVCATVAAGGDHNRISTFIARHFGRCKQHVFVLKKSDLDVALSIAFEDADIIATDSGGYSYYLSRISYTVYVKDPYEAIAIDFLWPIRVQAHDNFYVVCFVTLERDPKPTANRPVITAVRHLDEKMTVRALNDLGFRPVDINKGIKTIWAQDHVDAFRVRFKNHSRRPQRSWTKNKVSNRAIPSYTTKCKDCRCSTLFLE